MSLHVHVHVHVMCHWFEIVKAFKVISVRANVNLRPGFSEAETEGNCRNIQPAAVNIFGSKISLRVTIHELSNAVC